MSNTYRNFDGSVLIMNSDDLYVDPDDGTTIRYKDGGHVCHFGSQFNKNLSLEEAVNNWNTKVKSGKFANSPSKIFRKIQNRSNRLKARLELTAAIYNMMEEEVLVNHEPPLPY